MAAPNDQDKDEGGSVNHDHAKKQAKKRQKKTVRFAEGIDEEKGEFRGFQAVISIRDCTCEQFTPANLCTLWNSRGRQAA